MDFVIIGGGPTGLMTAITLQEYFPDSPITIIEKRYAYTRRTILLLDEQSLLLLPSSIREKIIKEENGCYVFPPSKDRLARCYQTQVKTQNSTCCLHAKQPSKISIQTYRLEELLSTYAAEMGIEIIRPQDEDDELDIEYDLDGYQVIVDNYSYPFDVLIGADGLNSEVRRRILETEMIPKSPMAYGLAINAFTSKEKLGGVFSSASEARIQNVMNEKAQHLTRFFRSQDGDYYLGFILSKEEYQKTKGKSTLPPEIEKRIYNLCREVRAQCQVDDILDFSSFEIVISRSKIVGDNLGFEEDLNKLVFLVGDAVLTTHFFTGIGVSVGFQTGVALSYYLYHFAKDGDDPIRPYLQYIKEMEKVIQGRISEMIKEQKEVTGK